ncbi:MAG: GDSL-type esterase/lipase family protein [Oscillospiraceae bacterium]
MLTVKNKKLLCLGDSLTYGYGVRRSECWVALASEKPGWELINCGICGDTGCGMLARFSLLAAEHRPYAVFVMGGTNDIICSGSDCVARSCVSAIIQQAQAMGIKPLLGIPPRMLHGKISDSWTGLADFDKVSEISEEYSLWLRHFADFFGVPTVDFSELYYKESKDELSLDGIHPNKEGHRLMAELITKELGAI